MRGVVSHCHSSLHLEDELEIVDESDLSDSMNVVPSSNRERSSVLPSPVSFFNFSLYYRKFVSTLMFFYFYLISLTNGSIDSYIEDNKVSMCALDAADRVLSEDYRGIGYGYNRYHSLGILSSIVIRDSMEVDANRLKTFLDYWMGELNRTSISDFYKVKSMLENGTTNIDLCPYLSEYLEHLNDSIYKKETKDGSPVVDGFEIPVHGSVHGYDDYSLIVTSVVGIFIVVIVAFFCLSMNERIVGLRSLFFSKVERLFTGGHLSRSHYNRDCVKFIEIIDNGEFEGELEESNLSVLVDENIESTERNGGFVRAIYNEGFKDDELDEGGVAVLVDEDAKEVIRPTEGNVGIIVKAQVHAAY
ncbi:putative membrane protein [Candidatus Ichthyocystis hellenicum]|uniref:Putative membrane protein n=1 Tax=Candidatus Ichthyocystis hellenicum TaxID=1561003 RepID=A0A0S4M270_9BURK|nr:hypothetical protein [Candidatus Ichthyocystis hellenicum]CUT17879.1 putative membrane protein [Candidatus Ichthyocystis hellenicum]